jgi:hypothetical protein
MTVLLIVATGYVPDVKRRLQREREEELLFRGQEVVDAISRFWQLTQRYPTSLKQLTEGITIQGTRRVRFMRESALKDPITNEDWKLVRFGDPVARKFVQAYLEAVKQPQNPMLRQFIESGQMNIPRTNVPTLPPRGGQNVPPRGNQPGRGTPATPGTTNQNFATPSGSFGNDQGETGAATVPILGVISTSEEKTVRAYFELEKYSDWPFIFIPPAFMPQAAGDARLKALLNPILYPSDPLSQMGFGSMPFSPRPQRPGVPGGVPGGTRQPPTRQPQTQNPRK